VLSSLKKAEEKHSMGLRDIFGLDGRVAIVTGAAHGLGFALAEAMAEAGADVVCSDIDAQGLERTVATVRGLGQQALAVHCDVAMEAEVEQMVATTMGEFGRLDILFNNAGVGGGEPYKLHEYPTEAWRRIVDVDLNGTFYCARAALRVMVKQRSGKVINIASLWGLIGSSGVISVPAYTAAKGAVVNLTRELGLEYAPLGINVNAIAPGFWATRIDNGIYDDPDFVRRLSAITPAGRVAAAAEIKGTGIFLASAASDYMCGHVIVLDGGYLAG
jgi:NAD(P)-dependent dehydrogenase (short-subunit alcohol dehydrogenase family)